MKNQNLYKIKQILEPILIESNFGCNRRSISILIPIPKLFSSKERKKKKKQKQNNALST